MCPKCRETSGSSMFIATCSPASSSRTVESSISPVVKGTAPTCSPVSRRTSSAWTLPRMPSSMRGDDTVDHTSALSPEAARPYRSPAQSVDVVVSFETLEHHDQHDEMMREVRRVLSTERPPDHLESRSARVLGHPRLPESLSRPGALSRRVRGAAYGALPRGVARRPASQGRVDRRTTGRDGSNSIPRFWRRG